MDLGLRKTYRQQLTKLTNNVNDPILSEEEMTVMIAKIKSLDENLRKINEKLAPTFGEDQLEAECSKIFEYEEAATDAIARLEYRIKRRTSVEPTPPTSRDPALPETTLNVIPEGTLTNPPTGVLPAVNDSVDKGRTQKHNNVSVKLPKLDLVKFNGEIELWPSFWEQFKVAIHDNEELDAVAKFTYLKTLLTGRAAITIAGLTPSQASYKDAIEMLKNEFADQERIINIYIQKLLNVSSVTYDIYSLRKLYNLAMTVTKSLSTLGVSTDQYGLMVKSILFKALPYNMRIQFNKQKRIENLSSSKDNVSVSTDSLDANADYNSEINNLLQFIKIEIESIENAQDRPQRDAHGRAQSHKPSPSSNFQHAYRKPFNNNRSFPENNKSSNKDFTAAGLLTTKDVDKKLCLFCNSSSHITTKCDRDLPIQRRKEILAENKCCFRCLRAGHLSKFCRTNNIRCASCTRKHATIMCDPTFNKARNDKSEGQSTGEHINAPSNKQSSSTNLLATTKSEPLLRHVYLQTACCILKSNIVDSPDLYVRLIMDGGSQLTFIKETISRQLNLPVVGRHKISIAPFGSSGRAPARLLNRVRVALKSQHNDKTIHIDAVEVPEICFANLTPPSLNDPVIKDFALQYNLADSVNDEMSMKISDGITVLIGADNYWKIVTGETRKLSSNLTAVNSHLGWTIHGVGQDQLDNDRHGFEVNLNLATILHVSVDQNEEIDIHKFWDLETIGINADAQTDRSFTQEFIDKKIEYVNGRYQVSLPWESEKQLDSNFDCAVANAKRLTSRLLKNGKLLEYDNAVREYVQNDCAEIVSDNVNDIERVYYMPHRPVYREDKDTTKVRVCFNASASAQGCSSLNDLLHSGDNLVPDLVRILMNFRIGSIGLIADIEKAFLQISLAENERDSHRYLWYKEPLSEKIISNEQLPPLQAFRMKRVTFGVTTSPFLLAATLRKHLQTQKSDQHIVDIMMSSFYVDDFVTAVDTVNEAQEVFTKARAIMSTASMNLRKWYSNDAGMMSQFSEHDLTQSTDQRRKVLGILWHTATDELNVDLFNNIRPDCPNLTTTKRGVLQTIAKIFDPIGVLGPFTIRAKILMQKIWKLKLEWDSTLPADVNAEWVKWLSDMPALTEYCIPRCVVPKRTNEVQLHIFADASTDAYGTVAYVKDLTNNEVKYLMSKNRVAPIKESGDKTLTLPKLELTAAVCAVRLQKFILENLSLNVVSVFLWSDSKITLDWIKGQPSKWKPYVAHRVKEIQSATRGTWKYCPGKENPADLLTRGLSAENLLTSHLWRNGPDWLRYSVENWPEFSNEIISEIPLALYTQTDNATPNEELIFPMDKFSTAEKMFRITAYLKRFAYNAMHPQTRREGALTVEEITDAETYWIRRVQSSTFHEEITALQKGSEINRKSALNNLAPFLDEQCIMRLGGRLQQSELPYETKHPIILPKRSALVDRIVWSSHFKTMHGGVNVTLTEVRKRFWILQGRQQVKSVLRTCVICKRVKGRPGTQPFAPLPRDRITQSKPFEVTGTDFAGPLYVKSENEMLRKMYIMLFTCAVTRAIHLELVPDLSNETAIKGLRRFVSRRGVPSIIYSDNAKTFKRMALDLKEFSPTLRIKWKFIAERASWWGGWWERLVRTVKNCIKLTIGKALLTPDDLQTLLAEVEATVNSRPLTYIDDDPDNLLVLTPSHFLMGSSNQLLNAELNHNTSRNELLKMWKSRHRLTSKFWKRWTTDYLQQLRSAHQQAHSASSTFHEGDVVLVHDQNVPRLAWKLARITTVYPGRDGRIRACEIILGNKTKTRRPIQLLYPLEVPLRPREDVENTA